MLLPYFLTGENHWAVICGYLVLFDIINAYGHTNIKCRNFLFESKWSPLYYLFYTPEFHLGHHALYTCNYGLFMPLWDHIFCTFREYKKVENNNTPMIPLKQQDFVFIGHNGGWGHLLTIPEISMYNIYDQYKFSGLPLQVELLLVHFCCQLFRLVTNAYYVSRYLIQGKHIGRVICILRTPLDYFNEGTYPAINREILTLIRREYETRGTRYFGLGNLNKMKRLNDGGVDISRLVAEDPFLKDKKVRIWTGDTLTTASVFHQLLAIPDLKKLFFIGGTGKIGVAVVQLLVERGVEVRILSSYQPYLHPLVSYTTDMTEMLAFKYSVIGKPMNPAFYHKILSLQSRSNGSAVSSSDGSATRYMLDYSVPFTPLEVRSGVRHIQIGVLQATNPSVLMGYFDMCFGLDQNHIYPCHAGCILNTIEKRERDETGEIDLGEIPRLWAMAEKHGLVNKDIKYTD